MAMCQGKSATPCTTAMTGSTIGSACVSRGAMRWFEVIGTEFNLGTSHQKSISYHRKHAMMQYCCEMNPNPFSIDEPPFSLQRPNIGVEYWPGLWTHARRSDSSIFTAHHFHFQKNQLAGRGCVIHTTTRSDTILCVVIHLVL